MYICIDIFFHELDDFNISASSYLSTDSMWSQQKFKQEFWKQSFKLKDSYEEVELLEYLK